MVRIGKRGWLGRIFTAGEEYHLAIRDSIVRHMTGNVCEKLSNYLNQPVNEYIASSKMENPCVWATDAEIMAAASLLGTDIVVYYKVGKKMQWLTYPASFNIGDTTVTAIYLVNRNNHFDVVIDVE